MKVLLVNRQRPDKMRYQVVPWGGNGEGGSALAIAKRSGARRRRVIFYSTSPRLARVANWPFVPDFIVAVTMAFAKVFGHEG